MKSSTRLSTDLARVRRVCVRGAEESLMLGMRWCLIVQRPGLSNCDWARPLQSEGQGKSEKLKSHNQVFFFFFFLTQAGKRGLHAGRSGLCVCDEAISQ